MGRAAAPAAPHDDPTRGRIGAGGDVLALTVLLAIVVVAVLPMWFGADSRPGPGDPRQEWFGRR